VRHLLNQTSGMADAGFPSIANDQSGSLEQRMHVSGEDDIARFMDEALARRQNRGPKPQGMQLPAGGLLRDGAASG